MEVRTNTPCGKKTSICADDICTGTICSAEKGGVSGSRNIFFSLGRFANVLELAVALWCKWYLRGRVEDFRTQLRMCRSGGDEGFFFPESGWDLVG